MEDKPRASKMTLEDLRTQLSRTLAERYLLTKQLEKEEAEQTIAQKHVETAKAAQVLIQGIVQSIQETVHAGIAGIVTRCLRSVFGEDFPHEFAIRFEQKRGKTEARLVLVDANGEEIDPLEADAGGLVDVISFALRLSCLLLTNPSRRRLLVLDEPFKMLSREYRPAVREMMEAVSEEFSVQILYVTHATELVAGEVVELD